MAGQPPGEVVVRRLIATDALEVEPSQRDSINGEAAPPASPASTPRRPGDQQDRPLVDNHRLRRAERQSQTIGDLTQPRARAAAAHHEDLRDAVDGPPGEE